MPVDLATVNLALDALLKLVLLGILVFLVVILKHLDKAIQSAGRSADSLHGLAHKMHHVVSGRVLMNMAHKYFLKRIEKGEEYE